MVVVVVVVVVGIEHRCEVTSLYQRTRQQTRTRPSECGNQVEKYYNAIVCDETKLEIYYSIFISIQHSAFKSPSSFGAIVAQISWPFFFCNQLMEGLELNLRC